MSIILHNVDERFKVIGWLKSKCRSSTDPYDAKDCQGLFVDWISTSTGHPEDLVQQNEIIDEFIKHKKKIIIFDRYRSMTSQEFNYLKKYKVVFWEPALFTRKGFKYQPCWVSVPNSIDELSLAPFEAPKEFDLGYNGSLRNKFKGIFNYYESMSAIMDLSIGMNVVDIKDDKIKELRNKDIDVGDHLLSSYKTMVLLGKPEDYVSGYLDPIFIDCINQGVIPVLPYEHRWYHAIFDGLVIKNGLTDLKHNIDLYDNAGFGIMYNLLSNIGRYHKEMTDTYVMNRIVRNFK